MSTLETPRIEELPRPAPLIEADVDLRDFQFMPLLVWRLRDSEFMAKANRTEIACAFLLWCAAWREKPTGSLPNDDKLLATCCKFAASRRDSASWSRVRRMALWNFVLCSDGRFYHPVICEEAKKAWIAKQKQRDRSRLGNKARWGKTSRKDSLKDSRKDPTRNPLRIPRDRDSNIGDSSLRSESHASSLRSDATRARKRASPHSEKKPGKLARREKPPPLEILKTILSEETSLDVIAHRKAKRAPLTPRAAELLVAAFRDHGDPEGAAQAMIANGWQGFRSEWMRNNPPRASPLAGNAFLATYLEDHGLTPNEPNRYCNDHGQIIDGELASSTCPAEDTKAELSSQLRAERDGSRKAAVRFGSAKRS